MSEYRIKLLVDTSQTRNELITALDKAYAGDIGSFSWQIDSITSAWLYGILIRMYKHRLHYLSIELRPELWRMDDRLIRGVREVEAKGIEVL